MGSLEGGGADEVINLPVKMGNGDAAGCLGGPCGSFSACGFGLFHLLAALQLPSPVGLFHFTFVILLSGGGGLRGPLSLRLLLSTCPAVSRALFRAQPGAKRTLRFWRAALAGRLGSPALNAVPQAWLKLKELEIRNYFPSPVPQERKGICEGKTDPETFVLFRCGPTQDKVANDWERSRPQWRRGPYSF